MVTDGTLPILGIKPMLGRWFSRVDDSPGSPDTVMLTYEYWRLKFGESPSIVGRNITVDGRPREVIGVMPEKFHFLDQDDPPLILPFQLDRSKTLLGQFSYSAVAQLKAGVTLADANADLARMLPIVLRSFPPPPGFSLQLFEKLQIEPRVRPLKQEVVGDVGNALWVLMGAPLKLSLYVSSRLSGAPAKPRDPSRRSRFPNLHLHLGVARGPDTDLPLRHQVHALGETISTAGHGNDVAVLGTLAERLPQHENVAAEVRLLHKSVRPHRFHQIIFGDDLSAMPHQNQ